MIRGGIVSRVKSLIKNKRRIASVIGLANQNFDVFDGLADYGFRSKAPKNSKGLVVFLGGQDHYGVVVKNCIDNQQIEPGDSTVYNEKGCFVKLEGDNITIRTNKKIKIGTESVELLDQIEQLATAVKNIAELGNSNASSITVSTTVTGNAPPSGGPIVGGMGTGSAQDSGYTSFLSKLAALADPANSIIEKINEIRET